MMLAGQESWFEITDTQERLVEKCDVTVSADGLVSLGTRLSAGTGMTKLSSCIWHPQLKG